MLVLILACAPADVTPRDVASDVAGRVSSSSSLTVIVDGEAGSSVQLVQIVGTGGTFTRYGTLSSASVSSGRASFSLGGSVGPAYLSNGGGNSAIFAVVLLDAAGAVVGVSDDTVGYYPSAPSGTTSTGWLVGVDGLHATPSRYTSVSSGVDVLDALGGEDTVALRGTASTISLGSRPRIQAAPVADSASSPWDTAIAVRWTATLSGTPDEDSARVVEGYTAAYCPLQVYDDVNGNGDWDAGSEPVIGAVCHGSAEVVVRWVSDDVEDLDAVYAMIEAGVVHGWVVGKLDGDELTEITDASSLRVRDDC